MENYQSPLEDRAHLRIILKSKNSLSLSLSREVEMKVWRVLEDAKKKRVIEEFEPRDLQDYYLRFPISGDNGRLGFFASNAFGAIMLLGMAWSQGINPGDHALLIEYQENQVIRFKNLVNSQRIRDVFNVNILEFFDIHSVPESDYTPCPPAPKPNPPK